jgi:hypothetical protein
MWRKRGGGSEESLSKSSSSESSDSNASKGLGWKKREIDRFEGDYGTEVLLKEVKGLTRTVGGSVGGLPSVPGRVEGGMTNREVGGGVGAGY